MAEVLIEYQRNGAYLKVTAMDPDTLEEAFAIGPASDPISVKNLAILKLKNKLEARRPPPRSGFHV